VEEALSGELEAPFKAEYEMKIHEQAEKFNQEKRKLEEEKRLFGESKEQEEERFRVETAKQLIREKTKIEKNAIESVEEKMRALRDENEKRKAEDKAMHRIWAEREKQIWVVQENISALFGSIKGIAGTSLQSVDVLELPDTKID